VTLACVSPAWSGDEVQAPQPPPAVCMLKRLVSLDMSTLPEGRVTIPITVAGRQSQFMVDSGAFFSAIEDGFARSVSLRRRPIFGARAESGQV